VTDEKCSQSHLLARLEANSRQLVQRQRMPDGRVLFADSAPKFILTLFSDLSQRGPCIIYI